MNFTNGYTPAQCWRGTTLGCFVTGLILIFCAGPAAANAPQGVDLYEGTLTVEGYGFVRKSVTPNPARRKLMARQAAINDAHRNLAELINGLSIRGTSTVKDAMVKNDRIEVILKGFIQGAQVKESNYEEIDSPEAVTSCTVVMVAPLAGPDGLVRNLWPFVREEMHGQLFYASDVGNLPMDPKTGQPVKSKPTQPVKIEEVPEVPAQPAEQETAFRSSGPSEEVLEDATEAPSWPHFKPVEMADAGNETQESDSTDEFVEEAITAEAVMTGVLFDARNSEAGWSLFPAVETENGFSVYDVTLLPASALEGYFSPYAYTVEKGREHERTRSEPLIVHVQDEKEGTLIISNEDGKNLLQIDQETKLLQKGRVIFVILPEGAELPK